MHFPHFIFTYKQFAAMERPQRKKHVEGLYAEFFGEDFASEESDSYEEVCEDAIERCACSNTFIMCVILHNDTCFVDKF